MLLSSHFLLDALLFSFALVIRSNQVGNLFNQKDFEVLLAGLEMLKYRETFGFHYEDILPAGFHLYCQFVMIFVASHVCA